MKYFCNGQYISCSGEGVLEEAFEFKGEVKKCTLTLLVARVRVMIIDLKRAIIAKIKKFRNNKKK